MKTEYVFPGHIVDEAINAILKASGSAIAYYSLPSSIELMRTTMQGIMNRALSEAPRPSAEPVGYLFFKSACRAPDDCEEYEEYVSLKDVNPDELAQYQKHDMVMPLYAGQPPAQPEQPAPISTIERLPTEADADCCGQVWALNPCTTRKWWVTHWTYLASNHRYTHWLPTGLTRPQNPEAES